MNKHSALMEWVRTFNPNDFLKFESINTEPNARSIVPNYGDFVIDKDVLGNKQKEYTFAYVGVQNLDTGYSDINEQNMAIFDLFNEWLEEQEKINNYPNFENCIDFEIVPLQNMANVLYYQDIGVAKYILSCKIKYTEKGE